MYLIDINNVIQKQITSGEVMKNIRNIFKRKKDPKIVLKISELYHKANVLNRLLRNLLKNQESTIIKPDFSHTFHSGLKYNYLYVQYSTMNLKFSLNAIGKIKIKVKRKRLHTNIINDEFATTRISDFLNKYSEIIQK
jgi:hypothetical protein